MPGAASPLWPLRTGRFGVLRHGRAGGGLASSGRSAASSTPSSTRPRAQRTSSTGVKAENARLRAGLARSRLDAARAAELSSLLGVAGLGGYKIVTAKVVARRGQPGFEDAVEIDVGTGDGVRPEMTVLNGDGLVGRVIQAAVRQLDRGPDQRPGLGRRCPAGGRPEIGVVNGVGENGRLVRFRLLDSTAADHSRPPDRQLRLPARRAVRAGGADRGDRAGGGDAG